MRSERKRATNNKQKSAKRTRTNKMFSLLDRNSKHQLQTVSHQIQCLMPKQTADEQHALILIFMIFVIDWFKNHHHERFDILQFKCKTDVIEFLTQFHEWGEQNPERDLKRHPNIIIIDRYDWKKSLIMMIRAILTTKHQLAAEEEQQQQRDSHLHSHEKAAQTSRTRKFHRDVSPS